MSKRRTESTSSSSSQSSIDDPSFTLGSCGKKKTKKPQQPPSANGRKSSVEHKEKTVVASTSTQLQSELGNIVKREIEEIEHNGLTDSAQQTMGEDCSSSAVGGQAQHNVRRTKRKLVAAKVKGSNDPEQLPSKQPSKRVCVSNPHEKYFEGCLVMAYGNFCLSGNRYLYWPGMIRRAGTDEKKHRDYFRIRGGKIVFYIQYFIDPTIAGWQIPRNMRLFNVAKPNQCNLPYPKIVELFEAGIRIAKAAIHFAMEDRLVKFTLLRNTSTTSLLKAIDDWNSQPAPGIVSVAQLENIPTHGNRRICSDSVAQEEDELAPPTNVDGESGSQSLAQNEIAPAPLANGNVESCPSSVEIMKKRIAVYQQKLRDECNREKDEEIKRLKTDKEKLEATLKEHANMIVVLQEEREKEIQEKLKYKEELEKMKAMFEEMFGGCGTK